MEKYNAVVEKVGEVQLTNDINLQGKRDYGEDYYTGTYQAEYKKFSDTEYLFGGTTIERAAGKQVELFCNLEITKGELIYLPVSELTCILPSAYKRKACEETVSHPSTHRYALYRM